MPAVPRSAWVHAEEVSRCQRLLTTEQLRDPTYAVDSPNWEVWFAVEHEEQSRRGVREVQPAPVGQTAEAQIAALWNTTFPWAGHAPMLVDLTGPDDDA
ncbi:hypothetical protein D1007_27020 [Hordeum vulgare]|nr:hypothetical protein D1007_27020 [Hordeum vulgare]